MGMPAADYDGGGWTGGPTGHMDGWQAVWVATQLIFWMLVTGDSLP